MSLEPLLDAEREAADALAAAVPATLAGIAAALADVRMHARDTFPLLDDTGCYVLITSAGTALRRALGHDDTKVRSCRATPSPPCPASGGGSAPSLLRFVGEDARNLLAMTTIEVPQFLRVMIVNGTMSKV